MDINEIIKIICTWLDKYGYLTDERVGECADEIIALRLKEGVTRDGIFPKLNMDEQKIVDAITEVFTPCWHTEKGYANLVNELTSKIIALSKQGEDDRTYDPSQPTTNTKRVLIQRILELENLLSKQEPVKEKCKWAFDKDDSHYDTSCGQGYIFNYGEREPEFMFCPYCQKEIEEVKEN